MIPPLKKGDEGGFENLPLPLFTKEREEGAPAVGEVHRGGGEGREKRDKS